METDPLEDAARVMLCPLHLNETWMAKEVKTPLDYLLRRDAYESLSQQAKEVISLVLKEERAPYAVTRIEDPKTGRYEKQRVIKLLREFGWSLKSIHKAFDELAYFVRSL